MSITRSGSTKKYSDNWSKAFGGSSKKSTVKKKATKKKATKKKTATKKSKSKKRE